MIQLFLVIDIHPHPTPFFKVFFSIILLVSYQPQILCQRYFKYTYLYTNFYLVPSIVRELIKEDHSIVNDEDENSNTALHLAAQYGHNKVAKMLLDLGADVSARLGSVWGCSFLYTSICFFLPQSYLSIFLLCNLVL